MKTSNVFLKETTRLNLTDTVMSEKLYTKVKTVSTLRYLKID